MTRRQEGCFFHLCKRLDFQVKRLGLMTKYLTDDDFKLCVKMLSALAFVPVSDVVANFESLATTFLNDELPLLGYFESAWNGQSVGGRRLPPMFSHHMWNVLDRAGTGSTGTSGPPFLQSYILCYTRGPDVGGPDVRLYFQNWTSGPPFLQSYIL